MLYRCDRVQIAVHALPLGVSRTGFARDWSDRKEFVPPA